MIHDEIVTYEVAKLAKEKGFDVPTRTIKVEKIEGTEKEVWDEEECRYITQWETRSLRIPTQSLLQRWLREMKNIHIEIVATACGYYWIADKTNGTAITDSDILDRGTNEGGCFDTYELALEDALKYALENLV
jgi:hypothetical protein